MIRESLVAALFLIMRPAFAQHTGGTLRVVGESAPGSLDTQINYTLWGWPFLTIAYDGLVGFKKVSGEESNQIVPDLAEAMPEVRDDGRTYVFRLRHGIRFSDGREVTVDDVAASFRRLFKVKSPVAAAWFATIVGGRDCLAAPDDCTFPGVIPDARASTVTVHLTEPDPEFLLKLGTPFGAVIPADTPAHDLGTQMMPGTGPYMSAGYDPNVSARFVRNPYFKPWSAEAQPAAFPDEIVETYGLQGSAGVTAIINGQADATVDPVPPDRLAEIGGRHAAQIHFEPAPEYKYIALNTNLPPFDNVKARRALAFAVDRGAVVRLAGGPRLATPICQLIPAGLDGHQPYCPYTLAPGATWTKPDMETARRLMAESGTAGQKVILLTDDLPVNRAIGTYLQSVLTTLGYDASVKSLSGNIHLTYIQNTNNRVQASLTRWGADYPAASDFINVLFGCDSFHSGSDASINISGFCDKDIDAAIHRALATAATDTAAAAAQWAEIDKRVTDLAPAVSLFQPELLNFVSARVRNYQYSRVYGYLFSQFQVQ